jgi:hypothetical protein
MMMRVEGTDAAARDAESDLTVIVYTIDRIRFCFCAGPKYVLVADACS